MTADLTARARAGDSEVFRKLVGLYLGELELHCYRILGSVQDAEDAVQETLLAAWQGLGGFEERASLRTWLYQVATNCCLKALRWARRRPQAGGPRPATEPPKPSRWPSSRPFSSCPRARLIPTRPNGQPAFGVYRPDPHTSIGRATSLLVLTLDGEQVGRATAGRGLPTLRWPRRSAAGAAGRYRTVRLRAASGIR